MTHIRLILSSSLMIASICLAAARQTAPQVSPDGSSPATKPASGFEPITLTVSLNEPVALPDSLAASGLKPGEEIARKPSGKITLSLTESNGGGAAIALGSPGCDYIARTIARAGDEFPFRLGEQAYVLRVEKLVTMTLGDDYGVFSIVDVPTAQRQRVERELSRIEQSDLTFLLDDRECTGGEMARYLREQLGRVDQPVDQPAQEPTKRFADLIDGINPPPATQPASAAATTNEATTEPSTIDLAAPAPPARPLPRCRVRTHDGRTIDLSSWIGTADERR